jgi:hypothetical protein
MVKAVQISKKIIKVKGLDRHFTVTSGGARLQTALHASKTCQLLLLRVR